MKRYVRPLFASTFLAFFAVKFLLRPWVLSRDSSGPLVVFVNSFPNFAEAVLGTSLLAAIAFVGRERFAKSLGAVGDQALSWFVTITAGVYVISQELGYHDLGGKNVTDPFDVVASLMGLMLMNRLLCKYGIVD